ncbi:MAG TPA: hypothetical protein ENN61_06425 [Bacteroidaceae bacterium]|nr:hypothetical protein [Bacteroidaceae bacterium]
MALEFNDPSMAMEYLAQIRKSNPRYIRDQVMYIKKLKQNYEKEVMDRVLNFCMTNAIFKATDMGSVAKKFCAEMSPEAPETMAPVSVKNLDRSSFKITPEKSNISDYKKLMN